MKFSYTLIKKLVPGIKSKEQAADALHKHAFQVDGLEKDVIDLNMPSDRYSDGACHWGVAKEVAAILNLKHQVKDLKIVNLPEDEGLIEVKVQNSKLCPRYMARVLEISKVGTSPVWMQKVLKDCGLRPINTVVDIMNYVMLETGQPLHAFDFEKLAGKDKKTILVRLAKAGEEFESIDKQHFKLDKEILVIADSKEALAIAGIKGGRNSEVDKGTERIVVESANFDGVSIYKASRKINLRTDASNRFSHALSPYLTEVGINRATVLLKDILKARVLDSADVHGRLPGKKVIGFDVPRFNSLSGLNLDKAKCVAYLKRLEFKIQDKKDKNTFLAEVPPLRDDVNIFEDLVEEVVRIYGLYRLPSTPPLVGILPAEVDGVIRLKTNLRNILIGFGFSEVYNSSFVALGGTGAYEVENPIAEDKRYLRTDLLTGLRENLGRNSKFLENLRIFEIGKAFMGKEELHLGLAIRLKSGEPFLELKGVVGNLLERAGLVDVFMRPQGDSLLIESDHSVLGSVKHSGSHSAVCEINLDKVLGLVLAEDEYRSLPKYPSIMRDLSLMFHTDTKVGQALSVIENSKAKYIVDVDLIDYYDPKRFTFRVVFRAEDHTLTDSEAGHELDQIIKDLKAKFKVEIR